MSSSLEIGGGEKKGEKNRAIYFYLGLPVVALF
jgi:hypothetical protein